MVSVCVAFATVNVPAEMVKLLAVVRLPVVWKTAVPLMVRLLKEGVPAPAVMGLFPALAVNTTVESPGVKVPELFHKFPTVMVEAEFVEFMVPRLPRVPFTVSDCPSCKVSTPPE